jgi:hypothetical protein
MATDTAYEKEFLDNNEDNTPSEDQPSSGSNASRKNSSNKSDNETKGDVKKKRDALEGREKKESQGESRDESGGHKAPKEEGGNSGGTSKQGLQSGQTTVQFGTGGNISSLGSLMSLFASSSSLARTDHGTFVNVSLQATSLTTRLISQAPTNQLGSHLDSGGKAYKEAATVNFAPPPDNTGNSFILQTGNTTSTQSGNSFQNAFSGIFKGISINAAETHVNAAPPVLLPPVVVSGAPFIPIFNSNTIILPPEIIFAYQNGDYSNVISQYLTDAGLVASSSYTYIFDPSTLPEGLTLNDIGDLTVDVAAPTSALVSVLESGKEVITVRISAGPGSVVTDSSTQTATFVANPAGSSMSSTGVVARISGSETVVGNAVNYSPILTGLVDNSLSMPGNVIYRHVFTQTDNDISTIKVPKASVYGNFETGTVTIPDGDINSPISLKLGGNVLDVYGSKENGMYGVGKSLILDYTATSAPSTVTLTGNILAGFGSYYGDLQTLTINDASAQNQTINFGSNQLYVDKAVASIIFPNIENLNITNANTTNLKISFSDNIIKGNQTSDIFYGEVVKFGDLNSATPVYNGFLKGVLVSEKDGHVVTTTTDGNSITWGNDVYTGGGQNPNTPDVKAHDTYDFTLLGTPKFTDITDVKAVAQGHITIKDFNATTDTLKLELTPDLFKGIDIDFNKKITAADLDKAAYPFEHPATGKGTIIIFKGGGSITLDGIDIGSFSEIPNLVTKVVDQTYKPVDDIPLTETGPFIYGHGPKEGVLSYNNELDNFFSNSLLATYNITGVTPTLVSGVLEYTVAPGVIINQYGTITVTTSKPIIEQLNITATDQNGNIATTTGIFGFLDAQTKIVDPGATKAASPGADIIKGGAGSTIIGEDTGTYTVPPIIPGTALANQTFSYGSNLIVSTEGGATVYGDYKTINLTTQGLGKDHLTIQSSSIKTDGAILNNVFNFNDNAFYVINGNVYSVAQDFNISASGGSYNLITIDTDLSTPLSLIDSGRFNDNQIKIGAQTIYGSGTLYGSLENINISAVAGRNGGFDFTTVPSTISSGKIDLSSQFMGNKFTFDTVNVTITGDVAGQTTTVYGSPESLSITTQSNYSKVIGTEYQIDTSATFSGNIFTLGDIYLKGGVGNTVFYSDPNLNINTSIYAYNGFIKPLVVTVVGNHVVTTSSDGFNNSITWGNDTLTGGQGTNTYNFSLLENKEGSGIVGGSDAVFTGFDTITNFNMAKDVLTFNLDANLNKEILNEVQAAINTGATGLDATKVTAADLDLAATFAYIDGNTVITFDGGGSLILKNVHIISFVELGSSLVINQGNSIYHTPTLNTSATFDPVFVSVTQANAFGMFIDNANPLNFTYTATANGLPEGETLASMGVKFSSNGTLTVKANGLVDADVTVTATDGTTTITLPTVHIFAIDAPLTYYDDTSPTINGVKGAMAYEVTASTVYGGGSADVALLNANTSYGSKLIYNTGTTPHFIYGVVQNITNDENASINSKIYTFASNLLNITPGAPFDSTDQIFGNAQNFAISVTDNGFTGNTLTFGSNIIYGSGTVFGNIQTISLTDSSSTDSIQNNHFTFGGNTLTSGAYTNSTTFHNSGGITNLFGNVENLTITGSDVNHITDNTFTFGDNILKGSSGDTNFYGDLVNFGNSNNPDLYGSQGFYDGVTVKTITEPGGETVISITDGNSNVITWGNDTYTAGSGIDTFNFTIVGTGTDTPIMQGFDTIKNFAIASDKLAFSIAYPVYAALAGSSKLTGSSFLDKLIITQSENDAVIKFDGGGSITLTGYGSLLYTTEAALRAALADKVSVEVADPISGKTLSTPTLMLVGNTTDLSIWSNLFNTSHILNATINGITFKADGTVDFGSNTGVVDKIVTSITGSDISGASATTTGTIRVLALDGTVIDQATGTVKGTTDANVIVGHGNKILGGGNDITYTAKDGMVETPVNVSYGDKLIYIDAPGKLGSVTGDVENVKFLANGVTENISTDPLPSPLPTPLPSADFSNKMSSNVIDFGDTWIFSNAASSTYGNAQNISMNVVGGTNIFSNGIIKDNQNVNNNKITSGDNTITASGDIFGVAENVSLNAKDGFYSAASGSTAQASISNNIFQAGGNSLTANSGSSSSLYGDYKTLSMTIYVLDHANGALTQSTDFSNAVAANSANVTIGTSVIDDNTFTFSGNTLIGSDMDSTLFAGIGKLVMANNEQIFNNTTQATGSSSSISDNHITFGNSNLTATGGITQFNNDIDDLSQTNFDDYDVTAHSVGGYVQITDMAGTDNAAIIHGNVITFGNNTMTASATGVNVFNLDLFSTNTGSVVAEGNTTIKNFGAPGTSNENMLNLQISEALYSDLSAYAQSHNITLETSNGVNLITADLLDTYMLANKGSVTHAGTNTTFNFSDSADNALGSITLTGVNVNSFAGLGSDLGITANGVTTIQATASPSNVYDIAVSGDSASAFTQNVQIFSESALGKVVDFKGEIDLNLSSAFFKAAGLSESNTAAQNFQILQDNVASGTGGITVSTVHTSPTTIDTILSFASGSNTYGSITLNNTNFTTLDPLAAHLTITHS